MEVVYRISSMGLRKLEKFRDGISLLNEVGSDTTELMNQDTLINSLSIINCELNTNFSDVDFESDVKLFEITPSITLDYLIQLGVIEEI
jgi:hypothetical protein